MTSVVGFLQRNYNALYPAQVPKESTALKIGILGAATIAPLALITPARSHPGVIIEAIAARDIARAKSFAGKHGIPRVFGTYQALLDEPSIDVVYIPLPNGLHYEWTIKALNAGKHVLLEKPAGNNAEETKSMFELAKSKNLVLLEAFHYRFHPAIQKVKSLIDSGVIGNIKGLESEFGLPGLLFRQDDIRFNFDLGGGSTMDLGSYTISATRYVLGSEPTDLIHISTNVVSKTDPDLSRIDRSMRAVFEFPNGVEAAVYSDLSMPKRLGLVPRIPHITLKIDGEEGSLYIDNFVMPNIYHTITVTKQNRTQTYKAYTFEGASAPRGEAWWSSYRYQLEAFVDQLRGRTPQTWVTAEDSVGNAQAIDDIYENSGLGKRPTSSSLTASK